MIASYSREIMISAHTASQLQLKVNDRILLYALLQDPVTGENIRRTNRLTVAGIFKTGIEDYDKTFAIGDIKLIQWMNQWGPQDIWRI